MAGRRSIIAIFLALGILGFAGVSSSQVIVPGPIGNFTTRGIAKLGPPQIFSVSSASGDAVCTIGEQITITGAGLGTSGASVLIGERFGNPVAATVLSQQINKIKAIVPAGIEVGTNTPVRVIGNNYDLTTSVTTNRLIALISQTSGKEFEIADADTLATVYGPFDFATLGITEGDGMTVSAPKDLAINSTGDTAYIIMKNRIYPVDMINGTIGAGIDYAEPTVFRAMLSPLDDYLITLSGFSFFQPSNVSRIDISNGNLMSLPQIFLLNFAFSPEGSFFYVNHSFSQISRFTVNPFALEQTRTLSGFLLDSMDVSSDGTLGAIINIRNGTTDQLLLMDLPEMNLIDAISPIDLPGDGNTVRFTIPDATFAIIADCLGNNLLRTEWATQSTESYPLDLCPYDLALPKTGNQAIIGHIGNGFGPPSRISNFDLTTNTVTTNRFLSDRSLRRVVTQN